MLMSNANQSAGLERIERLLDLVPYVATHQGIALEELAREFSISTSQLTEDLTTLWMCGLPGYTPLELMDLSFDTGFVSISNAETLAKPRILDRDEVLALILGLETLQEDAARNHPEQTEVIANLVAKLIGFIDSSVKRAVQAGTSALSNQRGILQKAITNGGAVEITYHTVSRDEMTTRVIHPLECLFANDHEYVSAFCDLTQGYRTFRLDRIVQATPIEGRTSYVPQSESPSAEESISMTLKVQSRFRDVVERFNLLGQARTTPIPEFVEVESFSADWATREIMGFGGQVDLISPQELRDSLRERALRALKGYQT